MKLRHVIKQFNWRFLLVRILVNAVALVAIVVIVPKIEFVDRSVLSILLMAAMLGVLNALVKPIIQFLTYPLFFATFGLITALTNALILILLAFLFPGRFEVTNVLWALLAGLLLGLLSSFLESLMGLTMPVVSDEPPELRAQLEEQAPPPDWFLSAGGRAAAVETTSTLPLESSPEPDEQELRSFAEAKAVPQDAAAEGDQLPRPPLKVTTEPVASEEEEATRPAGEEERAAPATDSLSVSASQVTPEEDPT